MNVYVVKQYFLNRDSAEDHEGDIFLFSSIEAAERFVSSSEWKEYIDYMNDVIRFKDLAAYIIREKKIIE